MHTRVAMGIKLTDLPVTFIAEWNTSSNQGKGKRKNEAETKESPKASSKDQAEAEQCSTAQCDAYP